MGNETSAIPRYREINDFLASIPSPYRTDDPDFFCLRLAEDDGGMGHYKPPFRKDFYFIALVSDAGRTRIGYDAAQVTDLTAFLVVQAPGLIYSFSRDRSARGYLLYFKKACFSFFKPDLEEEFPFFNPLQTNFFKLNQDRFNDFAPHFEDVFRAYEEAGDKTHRIAALKLLALFYRLRDFTRAFAQWEEGFASPQQVLLQKFIRLVNNFYIEKRTIQAYADLLHVTANHLSKSVKEASGRNALGFINDRLVQEAKSLIRFTDLDMSEIAYQLDFSDPANFGKFFKKHTGFTPLDFRKRTGNA